MICEIRNNNTEVVLSHITIGDIITFVRVCLSRNKEIVFNKPLELQVESKIDEQK
jgi:hypothetical protein